MSNNEFNPESVEPYYGKTFVTRKGTSYTITIEGRLTGRRSIEGARVSMIAGIPRAHYIEVRECLSMSREETDTILEDNFRKYGVPVQKGLHLAVKLHTEDARRLNRRGLVTSEILEIR